MKIIELVGHVWNPPGMDFYSQTLRWLWASLVRWPPRRACVALTVCYCPNDATTKKTISSLAARDRPANFPVFNYIGLTESQLFRRAIGRNICSATSSDIVWYIDIDQMFTAPALDDVATRMDASSGLCMPEHVRMSTDHATGHAMVERERHKLLPSWHESEFGYLWSGPCIGGVQVVGGDFAREHGYLAGTKWVEPVDPAAGFRSCRCDPKFRKWRVAIDPRPIQKLDIRGCYRIRHTSDGRDYNLAGENRGKEVW